SVRVRERRPGRAPAVGSVLVNVLEWISSLHVVDVYQTDCPVGMDWLRVLRLAASVHRCL
ncbi:hypothetical protein KUCAC02_007258, partial [Chaenocephalus aceratus]